MKCDNLIDTLVEEETPAVSTCCNVRLPMGLLGFEQMKDYLLIANPAEEPFRWLKVKDDISLAFVVIEPFLVAPHYQPDIPKQDAEFLGLTSPEQAILYNIVTIHGAQRATVNLKGPIVINRSTGLGKQVVIANAADYSVQYPINGNGDVI